MITNRRIKVWPDGFKETFYTDDQRCRFKPASGINIDKTEIITLLNNAIKHQVDAIKTENLYNFDGAEAYSLGQEQ